MEMAAEPSRAPDAARDDARAPRPPRTVREMLALGRAFLERRGIESARLESELLLAHALGIDRLQLFLSLDRPPEEGEIERARALLQRRGRREPCAYVTGKREFYGREFRVGPGVLIPRPETELLVDRARALCGGRKDLRLADAGTGSGCIAITLALELGPGTLVVASELSAAALAYARANAEALGARVEFREGDGLDVLGDERSYDLLLSNPPYIDPALRDTLAPEVREHEPHEALFAPADDLDRHVRRLLDQGVSLVRPGGFVLVELGLGQAARAREIVRERGLRARFERDLSRIERVLEVGPRA